MKFKSSYIVLHKVIKFSYFFLFTLLLSCGDGKTNKGEATVSTESKTLSEDVIANEQTILFFGDSLTAGYGIELEEAFPALIAQRLDSLNLPYRTVNSGVSGETTAGGLSRLDWILQRPVSVFVLELGANDGLRGIPLTQTRSNLQTIIDTVKAKNPAIKIILAGMQIPPNMGLEYTTEFKTIFPELAKKNNIPLIPFLLENVGGIADLNLEDGIHPTPKGHQIVMENVWSVLIETL